ncbi:MAG: ergothioneine biosynthesis protein EgtB [Phenylobacterium sp.]|uniref:ergothioneine biosynthesis protein EgtB n=1 Tax=Phenylobacterium sp. TaxID=1871053 RepID=UPI0039190B8D
MAPLSRDRVGDAARPQAASAMSPVERYLAVRRVSETLALPLSAEDQSAQSMPDASPTKWHLAHTTWFFETFILLPRLPGYRVFDPRFAYLFNSYYETLGPRQPRPERGLLTRPSASDVMAYRGHVDEAMQRMLSSNAASVAELLDLGLAHEEQHQELILMDVLHLFAQSPLKPAYAPASAAHAAPDPGAMGFVDFEGGLVAIGHDGEGFAFDNEGPRHSVYLEPYRLADRLVTNAEWLRFIEDGGYANPQYWLADGWARAQAEGWTAPAYWRRGDDGAWRSMTLHGLRPLDPHAPVCHVSYYEADAYAAWAGRRLPSEAEWEHAAEGLPIRGTFTVKGRLSGPSALPSGGLRQMFGEVWEWTRSAYSPYPGFRAAEGAVGEYNGKFMAGQMVLRGGACVTPDGHVRATYRNFFHPHQRWMFSGVRLAEDAQRKRHPVHSSEFARDVVSGLSHPTKTLSPKYFYDAEGSRLFEAICETAEYYPTRTEVALLRRIAEDLSAEIAEAAALVEFGSGASVKTRVLLDAAPQIAVYAPIDISPDALAEAERAIRRDYPALEVASLAEDFTKALGLPGAVAGRPVVGFFPGSTIGNFTPEEARAFLASARRLLGKDSSFIVGIDLVKDPAVLEAAYDDAAGVTAAFNKNLLVRMNRELGGDFEPGRFRHQAVWNAAERRIEMHLVSRTDQVVHVAGRAFRFAAGESLHTENSYKFTLEGFSALAGEAGWQVRRTWSSEDPAFAVVLLSA